MIDAEDRKLLMEWAVLWGFRGIGVALGIVGAGATFGVAWRLFDLIKG